MSTPHRSPIEQLIHSTVRIECITATGPTSGTGFYFSFFQEPNGDSVPCIVTNKHVIRGAKKGMLRITLAKVPGVPLLGEQHLLELDDFEARWILHPNAECDLAAMPLGPLLEHVQKVFGKALFFVMLNAESVATEELLNKISTMEDIVMIGYPNGLWDAKHNLPIIRKGITATHANLPYNGKDEFLIDAACFPGSSGSPVFLANLGTIIDYAGGVSFGSRVFLLGVLYAGPQHTASGEIRIVEVPTSQMPIALSSIPNNLGLVIQAAKIRDFEPILLRMMGK